MRGSPVRVRNLCPRNTALVHGMGYETLKIVCTCVCVCVCVCAKPLNPKPLNPSLRNPLL